MVEPQQLLQAHLDGIQSILESDLTKDELKEINRYRLMFLSAIGLINHGLLKATEARARFRKPDITAHINAVIEAQDYKMVQLEDKLKEKQKLISSLKVQVNNFKKTIEIIKQKKRYYGIKRQD